MVFCILGCFPVSMFLSGLSFAHHACAKCQRDTADTASNMNHEWLVAHVIKHARVIQGISSMGMCAKQEMTPIPTTILDDVYYCGTRLRDVREGLSGGIVCCWWGLNSSIARPAFGIRSGMLCT